jgi:cellulose synthase/poly-beta-1,6-N-acetylglucosamine synthase-like glycosyltransferase
MKKLSFLIAAHNEEKIIEKTLINLLNLPYGSYEVILGLDGCTDKTEEIVRRYVAKSKKFKYYQLNLRSGKPAVIDEIVKHASGDIIVINDADWIFKVESRESLEKFISVFNDPKVGGIAESFPVEWPQRSLPKGNVGFKMVAYSSFFWFEFQKKEFTKTEKGIVYVNKPAMFLTNVFLKKLYRKNSTLGDDIERTRDILDQGYKIVVPKKISEPRMVVSYDSVNVSDLIKQKRRTAIARRQLSDNRNTDASFRTHHLPAILYILKKGWGSGLKVGFYMTLWVLIMAYGEISAKFSKKDTQKGWQLRLRR